MGGIKRSLRVVLAGSLLFGGALTAGLVSGAPAAGAAIVASTIGVGGSPDGVSSDGTHVWVANFHDNSVTELDASTGAYAKGP